MSADTLANSERPRNDRPAPSREPRVEDEPQWLGPARSEVDHWKLRAIRAEARVAWLEGALYVARQAWACVTRGRP